MRSTTSFVVLLVFCACLLCFKHAVGSPSSQLASLKREKKVLVAERERLSRLRSKILQSIKSIQAQKKHLQNLYRRNQLHLTKQRKTLRSFNNQLKKRDIQLVSEINTILSVQNINEFQYKNCRIKVNNLSLEITEVNENEKK